MESNRQSDLNNTRTQDKPRHCYVYCPPLLAFPNSLQTCDAHTVRVVFRFNVDCAQWQPFPKQITNISSLIRSRSSQEDLQDWMDTWTYSTVPREPGLVLHWDERTDEFSRYPYAAKAPQKFHAAPARAA
jgi:hypothetical protein